jgi:hypothetical protein
MENSQKIEAYFNKELSPAEEQQLFDALESNADLKREFEFQNDIIEGIKEYRKAELIARLNEVKLISHTQYLAVKVITSIAVVSIVGLGAYFFYYTNNLNSKLVNGETVTPTEEFLDSVDQSPPEQPAEGQDQPEEFQDPTPQVADTPTTKQPAQVIKENSNKVQSPEVEMPDVVESFNSDFADTNSEEDLSIPANTATAGLNLRTELDVELKMKRKYNFHYQLVEKKLVLYGNFEEEPFEILEIIKEDGGVDLFLYYKEHFYGIVAGSDKIQPLKEIIDPQLVERLESLR